MSKLSPLSNTEFEVNGICYFKRTANTVAVIEKTLKYSGDVIIPESVTYNDVKYSVTAIEDDAFYDCSGLKSVIIPDSVTEIGAYAFGGCSKLTSICIPDSVIKIGIQAFASCRGLKSVNIPDSITEIGVMAFSDCSELTSIDVDGGNSMYCSYEGVVYSKDMKTLLLCPEENRVHLTSPTRSLKSERMLSMIAAD